MLFSIHPPVLHILSINPSPPPPPPPIHLQKLPLAFLGAAAALEEMKPTLVQKGVLLHAAYGVLNCLLTALQSHTYGSGGGGGMSTALSGGIIGTTLRPVAGAGVGIESEVGVGVAEGLFGSYGLTRDPMIRTALLTVLNHFR